MTTTDTPRVALPTLPGMVHGIVAETTNDKGRTVYTIQCDGCLGLETPDRLVLMRTIFNNRGTDRRRLCPDCQPADWRNH
jgi:hypothetical protein